MASLPSAAFTGSSAALNLDLPALVGGSYLSAVEVRRHVNGGEGMRHHGKQMLTLTSALNTDSFPFNVAAWWILDY